MKKKYYYLIIMIIMFTLVVFTKGFNMFGSLTDWYNQHIIFINYIKRSFISSNNYIVPFMGSITNIFSLSYYGLFNPLYIPYLFINIAPDIYMSYLYLIFYLVIGITTFTYLNTKYDNNKSLLGTIIMITTSPILFHLHRQVMFVNYLPFLLLGLYSIDKDKKYLLSISLLLIALTSFFYLIPSSIVLLIYFIYSKKKKVVNNLIIPIILGITSSMFLLLPTFMNLVNNRLSLNSNSLIMFLPNITFNSILYDPYSLGITILVLFVIYTSIFNKNKSIKYLGITLSIIFLFGFSSFLMNGLLYARSKVLIPFIYLVITLLLDSIDSKDKVDIKYLILFFILLVISFVTVYFNTKYRYIFLLEVVLLIIYLVKKDKKLFIYSIILTCIASCFITNYKSDYPSYINPFDSDINNLLVDVKDNDRVSILVDQNNNYNSRYNVNTTSIYSSSINKYYYRFIRDYLDLDQSGENYLMINPSSNLLYNTYLSNNYIIDYKDNNYLGYEEVSTSGSLSLYKNDKVLPIIYGSSTNNILLDLNNLEEYKDTNIKNEYELNIEEDKYYNLKLDKPINNKILVIKFNINKSKEERTITINEVNNKISSSKWIYYNHNEEFTYYISNSSISELNIYLSKGSYKLTNIKMYLIDYSDLSDTIDKVDRINDLKIENDLIKGSINIKEDGYLITNIPYDKDFTIYIDDNKVDSELVNDYFIGSKISKGDHSITIKYHNNYFYIGILISIISLLSIVIFNKEK